ncbi:AbrB family transcriptional regulator [Roseovarius aestuarii]|uniref:Putative ammonia monooxygenase n=1 Tax=Roseovarius aestuarii TaxID=475083 RepID=A0A1X7BUB9_9RHOB|nr:AbrB family transcriptional regulator [Roseovarius aestuarii]SMC13227.1 Putative ammonia monooxygenase [Roseovarius aestuarii]
MRQTVTTVILICISALTGLASEWIGLPLPYLLGPLCVTALIATALPATLPDGYAFPNWLRMIFIAVIGLMIGAQVRPELFADAGRLVASLLALIAFVALALIYNYQVFRLVGGYDRATAFYSSTPGGLYESLAMGEAAGADMPRLILQQFLRVIVVVTVLPIGLSLWLGTPVGSAGGMTLARASVPLNVLPVIVVAGLIGMVAGKGLRLPAGQLTGPMAVAALLSLSGVMPLDIPQWLVNDAQIVIGTALGMRFTGLSRALILRGLGLSLVSVGGMLVLAAAFAILLAPQAGETFDVMLISFAPGGVTEMALVALSLQANPAFVTLHHIVRILITVIALGLTPKRLRRPL